MQLKRADEIRGVLGQPNPLTKEKIYEYLNEDMINFIAHSPLIAVSTVGEDGFPSISPKGDEPGFVNVTQDLKLQIPERKGNKLAFSLYNIINNAKVGLIFFVPGTSETLRVHGHAVIIHEQKLNKQLSSKSQAALLVLEVEVTQCYFHCGKALLRSGIWSSGCPKNNLSISFGQQIAHNTKKDEQFVETFDKGVLSRYKTDL